MIKQRRCFDPRVIGSLPMMQHGFASNPSLRNGRLDLRKREWTVGLAVPVRNAISIVEVNGGVSAYFVMRIYRFGFISRNVPGVFGFRGTDGPQLVVVTFPRIGFDQT